MLLAQVLNLPLLCGPPQTKQVAGVPRARLERFCLPLALLSIVLLLVCSAALMLQEASGLEGVGPAGGHAEFLKIVGRGREPPPERDTVVEERRENVAPTKSQLSLIGARWPCPT